MHVDFGKSITRDAFDEWAGNNGFRYSPQTVGQQTFYVDSVEISLKQKGDMVNGARVSSYYMENLESIKQVAAFLCTGFQGTVSHSDPELI